MFSTIFETNYDVVLWHKIEKLFADESVGKYFFRFIMSIN
jgi:hypothetical protein